MKRQLSNSIYGVLDYAAYPIGMLAVAPFILRNLGVTQYGIWTVAASVVNIGAVVASGFGDATIQKVAACRGAGRTGAVVRLVRAATGIHLVLGSATALTVWYLAPTLSHRLASNDETLGDACLSCLRIAAVLTAVRAVETVCISTQRGFERYGAAVQISLAARVLSLVAAGVLASRGQSVVSIMGAATGISIVALAVQIMNLQRLLGAGILAPSFERRTSKELLQFGVYTWLIAASGVAFTQADRLIGGATAGAAAVVSYALCAQISQPVYGLTAAGLHFLFPHIASRQEGPQRGALGRVLLLAIFANAFIVVAGAGMLLLLSGKILRLLATEELARTSISLLPAVLAGSALLALSVTGSYAMVALGRVRTVALLSVIACIAIAIFTATSLQSLGVMALAQGRIAFALTALCVYLPLARELRFRTRRVEDFASGEAVEGA